MKRNAFTSDSPLKKSASNHEQHFIAGTPFDCGDKVRNIRNIYSEEGMFLAGHEFVAVGVARERSALFLYVEPILEIDGTNVSRGRDFSSIASDFEVVEKEWLIKLWKDNEQK